MAQWTPTQEWAQQDAVIIGGGSSLAKFDFQSLRGRNTIGCNDAFRLGPEIVKVCLFGDASWFHRNKWDLEQFTGRVATLAPSLYSIKIPWLLTLTRSRDGLHTDGTIGWNHSTGAAAVNLALSMGAVRIFLLGFDMCRRPDGRTHWHNHNPKPVQDESYRKFLKGFKQVEHGLGKFPGARIFNVTDGSSQLPYFAKMGFETFIKYVPPQNRVPCIRCQKRKEQAQELARV